MLEEHEESGICVCVLVVVVLGESGLGHGLGGWGGVKYVCVVSLYYMC